MAQLVPSLAPYLGLLFGATALAVTSRAAVTGGESYPRRVTAADILRDGPSARWLTLVEGTFLMTEVVVDTQVESGSGDVSPDAYLVPYVPPRVTAADHADGAVVLVRFGPETFADRFPEALALIEGGTEAKLFEPTPDDAGWLEKVFDQGTCEVLAADSSTLSPPLRHFVAERWRVDAGSIHVFDADRRPMARGTAVLWFSSGLGVFLAGMIALLLRAQGSSRMRRFRNRIGAPSASRAR